MTWEVLIMSASSSDVYADATANVATHSDVEPISPAESRGGNIIDA